MIITGILFIIYNIRAFMYSNSVFKKSNNTAIKCIAFTLINLIAFVFLIRINMPEIMMYAVLFVLVSIEYVIIFNNDVIKSIYCGASYLIHFLCMRLLTISIVTLILNLTPYEINANNDLFFKVMAISLALSIIYLEVTRLIVPSIELLILTKNREQLVFATVVSILISMYMLIDSLIFITDERYSLMQFFLVTTTLSTILGYYYTIIYSVKTSKLKVFEKIAIDLHSEYKEHQKAESELMTIAYTDSLTGLFNRRYGLETLTQLIINAMNPFSVVYIDIDRLKYVNDKFGHNEGDKYINYCVQTIVENCRISDVLCRMGGDEFMLLLPNCTENAATTTITRAYNSICNDEFVQYPRSVSYGVVEVSVNSSYKCDKILNMADEKMYVFKNERRK